MKKFNDDGRTVQPVEINEKNLVDKVSPGVYRVSYSMDRGYFLLRVSEKFPTPTKIYGKSSMPIETMISEYDNSNKQMGILLTGLKGSGKTLFAQLLCNELIETRNLPVLLVDDPYTDQGFQHLVNSVGECVVMFDEFAKVYNKDQASLLTFFDGANSSKRIAIVLENDIDSIDTYMINRPGRMLFKIEYDNLPVDLIDEMCDDFGIDKDLKKDLIKYVMSCREFSSDMLKSLLTFILNQDASLKEALSILNLPRSAFSNIDRGEELEVIKIIDTSTGTEIVNAITNKARLTDSYLHLSYLDERRLGSDLTKHLNTLRTKLEAAGKEFDESLAIESFKSRSTTSKMLDLEYEVTIVERPDIGDIVAVISNGSNIAVSLRRIINDISLEDAIDML